MPISPNLREAFEKKYPVGSFNVEPIDRESILSFIAEREAMVREEGQEKVRAVFQWLLGMKGDFPFRGEGEGAYYWRPALRKFLDRIDFSLSPLPKEDI